jgi:hypothetical protein
MMCIKERVFLGVLTLLLPASGFACSMSQWDTPTGVGAVIVGSPQTGPAVPRYSESCGLQVTAPSSGHVQDNSPDGHTQFIARFYVRPNLTDVSGTQADLFVAYSDEAGASPLLKVSYDGANLDFHAAGAPVATVAAAPGLWHLVEVEYNSAGNTEYWVNTNAESVAATGSYASATGAVSSVRLGLPNGATGFTGSAQFDAYESHSTTPVGPLIACDADGSDNPDININDVLAVITERFGQPSVLAAGQPDCAPNGTIDINDVLATIDVAF